MTIKYVILFHPRSGSSWLGTILAKNNCFTNGEPLFRLKTAEEQANYVREFFNKNKILTRATGFKIAPYQLDDREHMIKTLREIDLKILLVTRKDILKVAISQIRRAALEKITEERHGRPIANLFDSSDRPAPVSVNCGALLNEIDQNMREREASIWIAKNSNLPYHHVTYEELFDNLEHSLENISDFLGVSIIKKKVEILKNSSDDLREAVSNYDEMIEHLAQSQFADLIPSS